jgi:hypothetical protein
VAASALALTACARGEAPQAQPTWVEQSAAPSAEPAAAPSAARIGAAGSACEMPVSFELAESWKPKAVTIKAGDPLAELGRRGPLTMVCEIDAKPAGNIGFLRVWTGGESELRASLTAFIGKGAREPVFTELRIGDRPALEVVYQQKDPLSEAMDEERAFAVETTKGIAAISLDSLDSEEHKSMLPAYELARSSLTATP